MAALGAVWQGVKISHNLTYLAELAQEANWEAVISLLWHPSPALLVTSGVVLAIAAKIRSSRPKQLTADVAPADERNGFTIPSEVLSGSFEDLEIVIREKVERTRTIKMSRKPRRANR